MKMRNTRVLTGTTFLFGVPHTKAFITPQQGILFSLMQPGSFDSLCYFDVREGQC